MAHELSHVVLRHGTAQATEAQSAKYQIPAIGGASLGMYYEIRSSVQAGQAPAAIKLRATGVVVYSEIPHGKPVRIPDDLRHALQPYLQNLPKTP